MIIFKLNTSVEKWLHQNKAEYTGDFFARFLFDNFMVSCKNGVAAFFERYVNEWSSCYEIHFAKTDNEISELYDGFYSICV